ncbi:cytochrome P450 [Cylindrobasidium torrendii FP15055 ss-10]|uniref:Cytochrome P450 n=1 Tax=Cylindrobasidium torrendii FP15055 ss-10 TaxID=1314674 RepID=A0A0D7B9P1_9AGAR|nr:cytochrome P450 [Cylindrobasidium torrendii FP15055 ss-10]
MISAVRTAVLLASVLGASALWYLYIRPQRNALFKLAGPPVKTWFGNHLAHISNAKVSCRVYAQLERRYGRIVRFRGVFPWEERLLIMDPTSMAHIVKNPDIFQKPELSRRIIGDLIGTGMLSAEGEAYHRQRRVILPAFSNHNLRGAVPVVLKKGMQLSDKWGALIADAGPSTTTIDMVGWINRVTFDVIGLIGFDYDFGAVQDQTNELLQAYMEMFGECTELKPGWLPLLALYFPAVFRPLCPDHVAERCKATIDRIAGQLVQEKLDKLNHDEKNGCLKAGNDLLTLMIKANLDPSVPKAMKLSQSDLLDNINTNMFAGHDSSSLAVTWTLYLLARSPDVQTRLRAELLAAVPGANSLEEMIDDDLEGMHPRLLAVDLLHNVVRESLRLIPPIHSSLREATRTDEVPTGSPVHLNDGSIDEKKSFTVPEGTFIHICIEAFNLDKGVWGEDAWDFNPDRWDNLPEAVSKQPGAFTHLLTFSGGPRACPGMRFAVTELKLLLFVLITRFVFAVPEGIEIIKVNKVLTRPHVAGRVKEGACCPLLVSRYQE